MNAAVNYVAANSPPRNLKGEVGIVTILLLIASGMLIWGAYRSYSTSDKKKRKIFFPILTALSGVFLIGLTFYMYNNRKSLANIAGAVKNKTTAGFQAGANKFAEFRAARAAGAAPPGVTGNFRAPVQGAPPPALATA
jgi:hypothetical protein